MTHEGWKSFLESKDACAPGYEWAKEFDGAAAAIPVAPDGGWILWLVFHLAGDDRARRAEIVSALIPSVEAEVPLCTGEVTTAVTETIAALKEWVKTDSTDVDGVVLATVVDKWCSKMFNSRAKELRAAPFNRNVSYSVYFTAYELARTCLADVAPAAVSCVQAFLSHYLTVLHITDRIPAPGDSIARAAKGADFVRSALSSYFSGPFVGYASSAGI